MLVNARRIVSFVVARRTVSNVDWEDPLLLKPSYTMVNATLNALNKLMLIQQQTTVNHVKASVKIVSEQLQTALNAYFRESTNLFSSIIHAIIHALMDILRTMTQIYVHVLWMVITSIRQPICVSHVLLNVILVMDRQKSNAITVLWGTFLFSGPRGALLYVLRASMVMNWHENA